jgi:hypothetical protein
LAATTRAKSPIAPIRMVRPVSGSGTSRTGATIAVSRGVIVVHRCQELI